MNILVTGGAGYIGGIMVKALLDRGDSVTVFDNLSHGHRESVDERAEFIEGDLRNPNDISAVFQGRAIDAILHFAGLISVEESEREPGLYHEVNVQGSENLFTAAVDHGVTRFIFSSSAAVYGNPEQIPIPEDHPKNPTSVYGETKLAVEKILSDLRQEKGDVSFVCLRYFNACGALLTGSMGEAHNPETHIIPLAIHAVQEGQPFKLFGTDYDTPDGTCVRDYIHVIDLVEAHMLALGKIMREPGEYYYNVGTGTGLSNREVLSAVQTVSGKTLQIVTEARRAGDSSQLVADPTRIQQELGFTPQHSDIQTIVTSAWKWHSRNEK